MPTLRRRIYDGLPGPLRRATRTTLQALRYGTAGVSRRTVARSLSRRAVGGRDGASRLAARGQAGSPGTILIVDDRIPEHDVHAGSLAMWHYLGLLSRAGWTVIYRPDDGEVRQPYTRDLEQLGIEVLHGPLDIADWFALHGRDLDVVVVARPNVASRYLPHIRRRSRARVLYLDHDLHHLREHRRYLVTGAPEALSESRRLLEMETEIFNRVDTVLTFSADEVPVIRQLAPRVPIRVLTPSFYRTEGPAPGLSEPPLAVRREIVFLGAYDHLPNVDAAIVLVRDVMPIVWERVPSAHVMLIGGHVSAEVSALAGDRVEVVGQAPELAPYWSRARMSVSPLRYGSGVKGKIVASLEAGVPVVTTPIGNEGIGLVPDEEALIGTDPEELAAHVIALYEDPQLAETLARAGRRVLAERYSEERARVDLFVALGMPA